MEREVGLRERVAALVRARAVLHDQDHDFTPAPVPRRASMVDPECDALEQLDALSTPDRLAVVELLRDSDPDLRREAANLCGRWRLAAAVEPLRGAVADPHPKVRDAAGVALVELTREAALAMLAAAGARCSRDVVRLALEPALQAFGAAVLPWVEQLDYAPDPYRLEGDAWWKLFELAPGRVVEVLARKVPTRRLDWVSGAAALVKHTGGGPWVRPAFAPLVRDRDPAVSKVAATVLRDHGQPQDLESLLCAADEANPWANAAPLAAALEVARVAGLPVLAEAWPLAREPKTEVLVLRAMAEAGPASCEPRETLEAVLRAALRSRWSQVAAAAIDAARALQLFELADELLGPLPAESAEVSAARDAFTRAASRRRPGPP